ncbi:isopeptide-forming domain-containing fimbrial protein [Streptomyces sp. NPDC047123]|uniref:DUF7927 domain-containing protein n=1 Tax=Streptomyces sp. NPDC047123 TaxID=3155622 RepID=UPI0033CD8B29
MSVRSLSVPLPPWRRPLRRFLAHVVALALLVPGVVLAGAVPAAAQTWTVEGEKNPSTFSCDRLFYSNYRSGMAFEDDASGAARITNTVITKRKPPSNGLPDYWSASMAAGTDPDSGKPTALYADYRSGNTKLYKHVSGTDAATDEIYAGQTRNLPGGTNWGGLGYDSARGKLYGAQNLSYLRLMQLDLKTGASRVWDRGDLTTTLPDDPVIRYGTTIPDLFVDAAGGAYFGMSYGGTYIYRLDPDTSTVARVVQVTGPGAIGGSAYGMAFHDGAIYLGHANGSLYRVNATTGASAQVAGGAAQNNQSGDVTSEAGGSWPITDLASCAIAPNLASDIVIEKKARGGSAKPGDKVTYTVTIRNAGAGAAAGVQVQDDLSGVVDDATYNDDARTRTGGSDTSTQPVYDSGTEKLSWTGDIPAGETVTLTYSVTVGASPAGDNRLKNAVTSPDSNCDGSSDDAACRTDTPIALLKVRKVSAPKDPKPGDKVTYTLTLTNGGTAPWSGAQVTDDLADVVDDATYNVDAVAKKADGSRAVGSLNYSSADKKLRWVGGVPAGETISITYSVKVGEPPRGNKRLKNAVTGPDGTNCAPGTKDPDCATDETLGGLVVKKTATPKNVKPGDVVTYTVTAENTGGGKASGVTLRDDLTGVVDDASYNDDATARTDGADTSTQPVYDSGTKKLAWTGDIAAGEKVTLTYTVKVGSPPGGDKKLTNAVVGPDRSSCPPGGKDPDCGTETYVGTLEIKKKADRKDVRPGGTLTYTVTVRNTGRGAYRDATFTDDLSGVLDDADWDDVVTRTAGSTAYDAGARTLTWTGDVAAGATVTVTYRVTVNDPPGGDKRLKNVVTGPDGSSCDPADADGDCATETGVKSLRLKKTATPANPKAGDKVTYTVTVENTGGVTFRDATFRDDLTDVLDDSTWNDKVTRTAGTTDYDAGAKRFSWTGDLAVGAAATVTYQVTVTNKGDKYLRNVVTATDSNCPVDSRDPDCRTVLPKPELDIEKTAAPKNPKPGDVVTYTVTVTNKSTDADYSGASFTDDLSGVLDDATWRGDTTETSGTTAFDAKKQQLTWSGDIAGGAAVTVTYQVTVGTPPKGDKNLKNRVVGPEDSTCAPGGDDPACATETPLPTLEIKKTSKPAAAKAGEKITYRVTVRNTGQADYPGASFEDDLTGVLDDAVYGNDQRATSGTVTYAEPKVSWNGTVAKGTTTTVTYSVTVDSPPGGDKRLTNAVTGPDGSTCPPGGTDPDCATETGLADLRIKKTASPRTAKPGQKITYTVTVRNTGTETYEGASFEDDLTDVLKAARYDDDQAARGGGTVTYRAPKVRWTHDLPAGKTATVTYSVTLDKNVEGATKLTNLVVGPDGSTCEKGSTDPDCTTVVEVASLKIEKRLSPAAPKPGQTVTYTVYLTNSGSADYIGATVTDDLTGLLDDAVYHDDASATNGTVVYHKPRLTWTGDVPAGSRTMLSYTATVGSPPAGDKKLKNVVTGPDDSNCPPGGDDPDCATETPLPALSIVKKGTPKSAKTGGKVTYTLTVRNVGEAMYKDATLTDHLVDVLDDATWNGDATATTGRLSFSEPTLTWTGDLAAGATATIRYSVTVTDKGDRKLRNLVTADGSNCEDGSTDPDCRTELPTPRLEIEKTSDPATAVPGGKVTYRVTVRNTGTADARNVTFRDDLGGVLDDAAYHRDARATLGTVTYRRPALDWRGTVPAGATATLTYSVTVGTPPTGDKRLRNLVTSPDNTNCPLPKATRALRAVVDPRCTTTTPVQSLTLRKTVTPRTGTVKPGGKVTYTVTATNTGTAALDPATFTDDLRHVLDDGRYNRDATADRGTVTRRGTTLRWTGRLGVGDRATVTYSVRVEKGGDRTLRNAVTTSTRGGNCVDGTEPGCTTTTEITSPVLPPTGSSTGWWASAVAFLLVLTGGLLFGLARRRRH